MSKSILSSQEMRNTVLFFGFIALLAGCSSKPTTESAEFSRVGFPIASLEVAPEVNIFEPGIINSTWPEFSITFNATGDTLYFGRTIKDRTKASIMRSVRVDNIWQDPSVASFSGPTFDVDPKIMADGSVFYGSLQFDVERDSLASFDIWVWGGSGDPIRLPRPLNSDANESFMTGTLDGALYFGSNRDGRASIFKSEFTDGNRQAPIQVPILGAVNPGNPLVSPDGSVLIFASEDENGWTDLSYMCNVLGTWSTPISFPDPINSEWMEYAPGIDNEGWMFFTSERPGMVVDIVPDERMPADIYKSNVNISQLCQEF